MTKASTKQRFNKKKLHKRVSPYYSNTKAKRAQLLNKEIKQKLYQRKLASFCNNRLLCRFRSKYKNAVYRNIKFMQSTSKIGVYKMNLSHNPGKNMLNTLTFEDL